MIKSEIKRLAKKMFFAGIKPADIAEGLNTSLNTVNHWIHKGGKDELPWAEVRATMDEYEIQDKLESNLISVGDVISLGTDYIYRQIASMHVSEAMTSPEGLKKLAEVIEVLSKIEKNRAQEPKSGNNGPGGAISPISHPFFTKKDGDITKKDGDTAKND